MKKLKFKKFINQKLIDRHFAYVSFLCTALFMTSLPLTTLPSYAGGLGGNSNSATYRPTHGGYPEGGTVSDSEKIATSSPKQQLEPELSPKEYFDQLELNPNPETDQKFIFLNTRNGRFTNEYIRNLHHGIYASFVPWFNYDPNSNQKSNQSRISYEQMMRNFHVNAVHGIDGVHYTGNSPQQHGYTGTTKAYPGVFFHDVRVNKDGDLAKEKDGGKPIDVSGHTWHVRVDVAYPDQPSDTNPKPEEGLSSRFKRLQAAYVKDPAKDKPFEAPSGSEKALANKGVDAGFRTDPNRQNHYSLDVIRMPGTELPIPVHNQVYENTVLHQYPKHEMKPYFLQAMSEVMNELRQLAHSGKRDNETLRRVTELVTRYMYLGSHAHLFHSVNASLIVGQANYILSRFNLEGIKSGTLDLRGMYEQYPEFYDFVHKELVAKNPILSDLKTELPRSPLISILAHIQGHGDLYFPEGQEIKHPTKPGKRIEGIMVTSALPSEMQLQYMAHIQGTPTSVGGDTEWTDARTFVGTAGQHRALEGVAFRIQSKSGAPVLYDVHYQVQIAGGEWTPVCTNGNYCGTRGQSKRITGMKVWLTQKQEPKVLADLKEVTTGATGQEISPQEVAISNRTTAKAPSMTPVVSDRAEGAAISPRIASTAAY